MSKLRTERKVKTYLIGLACVLLVIGQAKTADAAPRLGAKPPPRVPTSVPQGIKNPLMPRAVNRPTTTPQYRPTTTPQYRPSPPTTMPVTRAMQQPRSNTAPVSSGNYGRLGVVPKNYNQPPPSGAAGSGNYGRLGVVPKNYNQPPPSGAAGSGNYGRLGVIPKNYNQPPASRSAPPPSFKLYNNE